jgi:hypothetical protein
VDEVKELVDGRGGGEIADIDGTPCGIVIGSKGGSQGCARIVARGREAKGRCAGRVEALFYCLLLLT